MNSTPVEETQNTKVKA